MKISFQYFLFVFLISKLIDAGEEEALTDEDLHSEKIQQLVDWSATHIKNEKISHECVVEECVDYNATILYGTKKENEDLLTYNFDLEMIPIKSLDMKCATPNSFEIDLRSIPKEKCSVNVYDKPKSEDEKVKIEIAGCSLFDGEVMTQDELNTQRIIDLVKLAVTHVNNEKILYDCKDPCYEYDGHPLNAIKKTVEHGMVYNFTLKLLPKMSSDDMCIRQNLVPNSIPPEKCRVNVQDKFSHHFEAIEFEIAGCEILS